MLTDRGTGRVAVEAETRVTDFQALARRIALKQRDDSVERVILLVAATRGNRGAVRAAEPFIGEIFALDTRSHAHGTRRGPPPTPIQSHVPVTGPHDGPDRLSSPRETAVDSDVLGVHCRRMQGPLVALLILIAVLSIPIGARLWRAGRLSDRAMTNLLFGTLPTAVFLYGIIQGYSWPFTLGTTALALVPRLFLYRHVLDLLEGERTLTR